MPVRFWDFLFYASFGLVVTRSVAIAGVLLVFCYLIVPSVGGMLSPARIGPTARHRLGDGRGRLDARHVLLRCSSICRPAPTIVCTFGLVLAAMAAVRPLLYDCVIQNAKCKQISAA